MKKRGDYVSMGTPTPQPRVSEGSVEWEDEPLQPLSSRLHPADLPRDYGMAGAVGAYEVKRLTQFIGSALKDFEQLPEAGDGLAAEAVALLDRLMPPAERHQLALERVTGNTLVLSMSKKGMRYYFNRGVVPKLTAALRPMFGPVRVQLVDRLS